DLFLLRPIRPHAPDLHGTAAFGIEVDVLAVGRIFRAVVEPRRRSEARLLASIDWDGVNIEVPVAVAGKRQGLAVRRPAVPVGRPFLGDTRGRAAFDRNGVD